MITFRLDPASGVPTYLQLVHQVKHALRVGQLQVGDQLPLVREVVASLAINPNTVLKAYRQLESAGLTVGRPGVGTFVRVDVPDQTVMATPALRRRLSAWVDAARKEGLDDQDLSALFASALHDSVAEGVA
ncbi:GntR family transcriptional regulator [Terrabacter sp. Ter38]|uniref:GntR family transcriptional regulator n=1 Tax=Terrabacter sp. Ter38 TaxID=2926030 RepID=UPI0021184D7B|nr:GntR family transcriptional regulator [Terrabacter sp. Ter38]